MIIFAFVCSVFCWIIYVWCQTLQELISISPDGISLVSNFSKRKLEVISDLDLSLNVHIKRSLSFATPF